MKKLQYSVLCALLTALIIGGFSCDRDDGLGDDDGGGEGTDDKKAIVQVLVKRKSANNTLNNYTSLVVLGKYRDSMNRFEYELDILGAGTARKPILKNYETLKQSGNLMDTFYTRKGNLENPNTGKTSGAAVLNDLEDGTYTAHVLDGNLLKTVLQIEATAATEDDDIYIAEIQELCDLKVIASLGSTAGSNMDDVDVRLYGYSSDTLSAALTGNNPGEITVGHYYQAFTATIKNENGNKEEGIAFFYDIPVRNYYVLGHSGRGSNTDQAQHASTSLRKNQLSFALLAF